jgi:hypothetical protein
MKITVKSTLTKIVMPLTVLIGGISLTQAGMAIPAAIENGLKQTRSCTPQTCTPYRANYERAIATGIIRRPSGVEDVETAISLADRAMSRGDRNEAALRLAQALVILSEKQGNSSAVAFERTLDADTKAKRGQNIRAFLPLFGRIFPTNQNPYRNR